MKNAYSNILFTALVTVFCLFSVAYVSCKKTAKPNAITCEDVNCQNGGVCTNAVCKCIKGYQGTYCEIEWTSKFAGSWNVSEKLISQDVAHAKDSSYMISITQASTPTAFFIDSLLNNPAFSGISCVVDSTTTGFALAQYQYIDGSQLIVVGGNGTISSDGNSITGTYYRQNLVSASYGNDTFSFQMTRISSVK
ncbi:MAG TPA: calcium-binding EGF-like domain-containing protein [Flavipsychrobacter sp.]|nr:calcium-binding EGF-like domain-containing protein [Flavipsychrobacter sp.]